MRIVMHGIADYEFYYFLGNRLGLPAAKIYLVTAGLLGAMGAIGLFRCKVYGPALVLLLLLLEIVNDATSLPLVREVMEDVIARSSARHGGRTLPFDTDTLFSIFFTFNVAFFVVVAILLGFLRKRFVFKGVF